MPRSRTSWQSSRHPRNVRPGAMAVELALWLPFLALMFAIAVDFCRVFHYTQILQNCAETGALYASGQVQGPESMSTAEAACNAVLADGVSLNPPLTSADIDIAADSYSSEVCVTYVYRRLVNWPGYPAEVTLKRSCRMPLAPKYPGQ